MNLTNTLVSGDCFKVLPFIEDHSIDLILTDLPIILQMLVMIVRLIYYKCGRNLIGLSRTVELLRLQLATFHYRLDLY